MLKQEKCLQRPSKWSGVRDVSVILLAKRQGERRCGWHIVLGFDLSSVRTGIAGFLCVWICSDSKWRPDAWFLNCIIGGSVRVGHIGHRNRVAGTGGGRE